MKTGTIVLIGAGTLVAGTIGVIIYRKNKTAQSLPDQAPSNTIAPGEPSPVQSTVVPRGPIDTPIKQVIADILAKDATALNTGPLKRSKIIIEAAVKTPAPAFDTTSKASTATTSTVIRPASSTTVVNTKTKQGAAMQGVSTYNLLN